MKNFFVPPFVSSRVYYAEHPQSRAYLYNECSKEFFLLEGITSDLWNIIISSENYNEVKSYAKLTGVENELDVFLNELKMAGLIADEGNTILPVDNQYITSEEAKKEEKIFIDNLYDWARNNNLLLSLFLELSYKCNENCIHCFNHKDMNEYEINITNIKKIIDDAYKLGLFSVTLSGGECTITNDFIKIAQYIKQKRISLSIFTNGQSLYDNDVLFEQIVNLHPYKIGISLYSMIPEIHDCITRVKGSHAKTISVINKLKERNISIELKCFLCKYNIDTCDDVIKFAEANNLDISIDEHFFYNPKNKNDDVKASLEQIYNFVCRNSSGKYYLPDINPNNILCRAGHTILSINPKLDVFICNSYEHSIGNLNEKSLNDIWNDKNSESFLNIWKCARVKNLKECNKNDYCHYCRYCAGFAYRENSHFSASKTLCDIAKIRMKADKKVL